jgi:hypothetical protein
MEMQDQQKDPHEDDGRDLLSYDFSNEEIEEEARLFQHNRQFQATVLEKLDATIAKAEEDIGNLFLQNTFAVADEECCAAQRDEDLQWSERSRQDLAIALKKALKQVRYRDGYGRFLTCFSSPMIWKRTSSIGR